MRSMRLWIVLIPALATLTVARAYGATTVEVGSCIDGLVQFATIQNAVNASPAGTTIDVCPGTYPEQVTINKNLTLQGVPSPNGENAAIITPPGGGVVVNSTSLSSGADIAAQILVTSPATSVSIIKLTVDGTGNNTQTCGTNLIGIYYRNASGLVRNSAARNQVLPSGFAGCQSGQGVYIQSGAASGTATVTVENSSVHNYQKNGITGNGSGTTLTAKGNFVQGAGVVPVPGAAQNGIQIGFGAKGTVTGNIIIDQLYGDANIAGSIGVLLFNAKQSSGITVTSNTIGNTQGGVGIYTDSTTPTQYGDGVTVQSNSIFETPDFDAVDVCTNGNTIINNTIINSTEAAIRLDSLCSGGGNNTGNNNSVSGNIMRESACAGIMVDSGTAGNTIGAGNIYQDLPFNIVNGSCPPAATASASLLGARAPKLADVPNRVDPVR